MQLLTKQLMTFAGLGLTTEMWNTATWGECGVSCLRLKAYPPVEHISDPAKQCRGVTVKLGEKRLLVPLPDPAEDLTVGYLKSAYDAARQVGTSPEKRLPFGTLFKLELDDFHSTVLEDDKKLTEYPQLAGLFNGDGETPVVIASFSYMDVHIKAADGSFSWPVSGSRRFKAVRQELAKQMKLSADQVGLFYNTGCTHEQKVELADTQKIADALAQMQDLGHPTVDLLFAKKLPAESPPTPLPSRDPEEIEHIPQSCRYLHVKDIIGTSTDVYFPNPKEGETGWGKTTVGELKQRYQLALEAKKQGVPLKHGQEWKFEFLGTIEASSNPELKDNDVLLGSHVGVRTGGTTGGTHLRASITYWQVAVKQAATQGPAELFSGETSFKSVKETMAGHMEDRDGRSLTADRVGLFFRGLTGVNKREEVFHRVELADEQSIGKALAFLGDPENYALYDSMLYAKEVEKSNKTDTANGEEKKKETPWWVWLASIGAAVVGVGLLALLVYTTNKSPGEDPAGNDGGNFEFYDSSDSSDSEEETDPECGTPMDAECGTKKKSARDVDTSGRAILPFCERSLSGMVSNGSANRN